MKKLNVSGKFVLIILLFILSTLCSNAQRTNVGLDSLKIQPQNPTIGDSLKVFFYSHLYGVEQNDTTCYSWNSEDTVLVHSYYTELLPHADCILEYTDSISIGKLSIGNYTLIGCLHNRGQITDSTYTDYGCVCDTINFNVTFTEIFLLEKSEKFEVFPNPVTNWLKIQFNDNDLISKYQLEICSLSGQRLLSRNIYGTTEINVSDCSSGIYLLTIKHNNKIIQTEKIIVE